MWTILATIIVAVKVVTADDEGTVATYSPISSRTFSEAQRLQCNCGGFFTRAASWSRVCGTNNVTYINTCSLYQAMKTVPGLGLRCNRPCPCENMATQAAKHNLCGATATQVKAPSKLKLSCSPIQRYCMTDGRELTRQNVFCAMAANPGLGVRAPGLCSEFAAFPCPAMLAQPIPMFGTCV